MNETTGKRTWLRRAAVFAGAVVLAAGVAACASPGGSTPGGGGHPTKSPGTPVTALPKASCGSTLTHGLNGSTQLLRSDKGALTCFHTAAKSCKAAGLAVTEMGVDTGTNEVIIIEPSGSGCRVTLWHQAYSANGGGSTGAVGSTQCTIRAVTGTDVTLSCAGQKLLIPATV